MVYALKECLNCAKRWLLTLAGVGVLLAPACVFAQTMPSGPYAWYQGDSGLLASGSLVTTWEDQSGNGRHMTQVIGSPTAALLSTPGGSNTVVRLDGASAIWVPSSSHSLSGDRSIVIYARVNLDGDGFFFDASSNVGRTRARVVDDAWYVDVNGDVSQLGGNTGLRTVGQWQTHVFTFNRYFNFWSFSYDYDVTHYVDGSQSGAYLDNNDIGMSGLILGADVGGNDFLDVDIAEVVTYNRVLSLTEASSAATYLQGKWGQPGPVEMVHAGGTALQQDQTILGVAGTYPLIALRVDTQGTLDPLTLSEFRFDLAGSSDLDKVEAVHVYTDVNSPHFSPTTPSHVFTNELHTTQTVTLAHTLLPGPNYFWLTVETKAGLEQGTVFDARVLDYTVLNGGPQLEVPDVVSPPETIVVGDGFYSTVVRRQGDDGVHTYRIPGLDTSNDGTLVAVFDIRHDSSGDLPGNIDVGCMRSTDGGLTWQPMQTIMDYDASESGSSGNGVGDPAVLVDRNTGRMWVMATYSYGNNSWNGSGPGLDRTETGQLMLVYSDDDGLTWSGPTNITAQAKTDPDWHFVLQGPGKGITLRNGAIVFPLTVRELSGLRRSTFIASADGGLSWKTAPFAVGAAGEAPATTESQIIEIDDGRLLLSLRNHDGRKERAWAAYTWDPAGGDPLTALTSGTWAPAIPGGDNNDDVSFLLNDPTCQASLERYVSRLDGYPFSVLLFANPNNPGARNTMTIRASIDEGQTWDYSRAIDTRPAAYSCMTLLPDGDIGILYETGDVYAANTLTFARFPLTWLVGDADTDEDGMSDIYELANGLNPDDPDDAGLDRDGDGVTNLEEFLASTRANDEDSVLAPAMHMNPDGTLTLTWATVPGVHYTVEASGALEPASWQPVAGAVYIPGDGTALEFIVSGDAVDQTYFRVRAHP